MFLSLTINMLGGSSGFTVTLDMSLVYDKDTRITSKQRCCFDGFIADFEQILQNVLVFPLLTLNK